MLADGDFDFIVVGAGSAACAFVSRLSENPGTRVLLIEAGPDTPPDNVPALIRDIGSRASAEPGWLWPDERVYAAVVEAYGRPGPWDERLLRIINARVSWVYELLHASEYGRELINEKNRICGGDVLAENDRFESLVAKVLTKALGEPKKGAALARILIEAVNGILEKAETRSAGNETQSAGCLARQGHGLVGLTGCGGADLPGSKLCERLDE